MLHPCLLWSNWNNLCILWFKRGVVRENTRVVSKFPSWLVWSRKLDFLRTWSILPPFLIPFRSHFAIVSFFFSDVSPLIPPDYFLFFPLPSLLLRHCLLLAARRWSILRLTFLSWSSRPGPIIFRLPFPHSSLPVGLSRLSLSIFSRSYPIHCSIRLFLLFESSITSSIPQLFYAALALLLSRYCFRGLLLLLYCSLVIVYLSLAFSLLQCGFLEVDLLLSRYSSIAPLPSRYFFIALLLSCYSFVPLLLSGYFFVALLLSHYCWIVILLSCCCAVPSLLICCSIALSLIFLLSLAIAFSILCDWCVALLVIARRLLV
jgi:hypothetical protein